MRFRAIHATVTIHRGSEYILISTSGLLSTPKLKKFKLKNNTFSLKK